MPYKKFERSSERYNKFAHAKIIAIVNQNGEIQGYDYTLTRHANDFFADPEDRKKYEAITVKPLACESMGELQEKFRVAEEFLRWGAVLATAEAQNSMKAIAWGRGSTGWMWYVEDNGMIGDPNMTPNPEPHGCKPSPRARGEEVSHADLQVVNEKLITADYKVGDRIQLCIINRKELKMIGNKYFAYKLPSRQLWVTIESKHTEMWAYDTTFEDDEEEKEHFFQDLIIGQVDGEQSRIEFNPKHVIQHSPMTAVEPSDSDSSDDEYEPALDDKLCHITMKLKLELMEKISEQQSDASPPVMVPTPVPSVSAVLEPQAAAVEAPREDNVLLPAPTLLRQRRYHPV